MTGVELRFRKKPIEVSAVQWHTNGDHPDDRVGDTVTDPLSGQPYERVEGAVVRFFRRPDVPRLSTCVVCDEVMHLHGWIDTLEGGHVVCPGDWIVRGVQGEVYPVKPQIFRLTYEPVTETRDEARDVDA